MQARLLPQRNAVGQRPAFATAQAVLARQLRQARQAQRLSRAELARRAGVSAETIARAESGRTTPRAATMQKLRDALGNGL